MGHSRLAIVAESAAPTVHATKVDAHTLTSAENTVAYASPHDVPTLTSVPLVHPGGAAITIALPLTGYVLVIGTGCTPPGPHTTWARLTEVYTSAAVGVPHVGSHAGGGAHGDADVSDPTAPGYRHTPPASANVE